MPSTPQAGSGELLSELTALFAEHTGYELDDFDPTYDLEADLGIDTVKQAEIFSLVRERYGLAKDENFKLSDVQTLNAIAEYVQSRTGVGISVATTPPVVASPTKVRNSSTTSAKSGLPRKKSLDSPWILKASSGMSRCGSRY